MFEAMTTAEEIGTAYAEAMCEIYGMDACVECAFRGKCTLADIYEG